MPALAHFGIGLATKRIAPKIPLWVLLISSEFIDILWIFLFFTPAWLSHGLFMAIIWSIIASLITGLMIKYLNSKKEKIEKSDSTIRSLHASLVIGLLVFSHWVLDFFGWPMSAFFPDATGVPLLFDDSQTIGLGLYSNLIVALIIDDGIFIIGLIIYIITLKKLKKEKNLLNKTN